MTSKVGNSESVKTVGDDLNTSNKNKNIDGDITVVDNPGDVFVDCTDETTVKTECSVESRSLSPEVPYSLLKPEQNSLYFNPLQSNERKKRNCGEVMATAFEGLSTKRRKILYSKKRGLGIESASNKILYEVIQQIGENGASGTEEVKEGKMGHELNLKAPRINNLKGKPVDPICSTNRSQVRSKLRKKSHRVEGRVASNMKLESSKQLSRKKGLHKEKTATNKTGFKLLDGVIWGACIGMAVGILYGD